MGRFRQFIALSGINQLNWLNPLLLALFPAALVIWLQPVQFTPFIFEKYLQENNTIIWFEDLQNDGKSERFHLRDEGIEGHACILYCNDKAQLVGQYNFEHPMAKTRGNKKASAVDLNKDGIKDLVFFTQKKDSLFLNAFDYEAEDGIINSRFITKIGGFNNHLDYHLNYIGHYDTDNDSIPEIFFSVASGFALYPRRVYRYNLINDSLITSLNTGAGLLLGKILQHKDSVLIGVGSVAPGNIQKDYPYPYHDSTTWFFCFDTDLNLKFPPSNHGISPGGTEFPIYKNGYIYYLIGSDNTHPENKLFKMNWQGKLVDSIVFDFHVSKRFYSYTTKNQHYSYFFNADSKEYFYLDFKKFEAKKLNHLNFNSNNRVLLSKDLNSNGKTNHITFSTFIKQIGVLDEKLKTQNKIEIGDYVRFVSSNYYTEKGFGELVIYTDLYSTIYRFYNNPKRYFKYPLWLAIYFISVLFVSSILFLQNRRNLRQQKMEQQLADLQLQNLRNQLDPHFTFNVLNSIGNSIYKQDKEAAYDLFQRFTRIIRSSLLVSDKVFRTLKEELQFTQDYLEFQKIRFKDRFDYSFEIEKGIDSQNIKFPKMLIQGFAENAVKHAFYKVDYKGQIIISIKKEGEQYQVSIEDNGIGINLSKKTKATSGTQRGEKILEEQVEQINRIYKTSYSIQITDKSENPDKQNGTIVKINFQ